MAVAAVAMATVQAPAQAIPAQADPEPQSSTHQQDNLSSPMGEQQQTLREEAVKKLVKGEATLETRGGHRVIRVPKGKHGKKDKFVQYDVNREESIFTVLTDFGTQVSPTYGGTAGPVHNTIPSPDRVWDGNSTDDNSTYWSKDFNRQHYLDMMFGDTNSFKDFYTKQSNGRFLAKGDVSDWVQVPYNEARYGAKNNADGYWNYIKDTAQAWYADQVKQGKTPDQIKAYLSQFDKIDRYDYDGDGNFNEPDGYIDHFQAIHAGEGEEAGGGAQGTDAIWSHRWYAFSNNAGKTGPSGNLLGGVPLGDSGIWIGDYTTEPENGGLGVFAHEFGHDLGLPDLYDTSGNTGGAENNTAFWTLMSSGANIGDGGPDGIGDAPTDMGVWEKFQLGWLSPQGDNGPFYEVARAGQKSTHKLGPN
ncbi:immune inhibitor A domain-containing protein, partial [Oryzihumus sp.]